MKHLMIKSFLFLITVVIACTLLNANISFRVFEQRPCDKLPQTFQSYSQALTLIKASKFKISESVNTSKSSWIRGASYYSCDGKTGFFIIATDTKEYVHKDVPKEIWEQFKNADSFGSYYSRNIKGRYRLTIN